MRDKIEWLKENKKEILIGAGVLVGTTLLIVIGAKTHRRTKLHKAESKRIIEAFEEATVAIVPNCQINLEKIPIKELGAMGKRFLDAIPEATEETLVNVIAYIEKEDLV